MKRRINACPYPAEGYVPGEEEPRTIEIALGGGEWWRGERCPVAVVREDGAVQRAEKTWWWLEQYQLLPFGASWMELPLWLVEAIEILASEQARAEREYLDDQRRRSGHG